MKMKQKGYTLVELLIVIAIIGLLVAILIPNLLDAQDRAKQRSTIAELRSWGTAIGAYMTEKGLTPCPTCPGSDYAGFASGIHSDLVPYAISALHDNDKWNFPFRYYTTTAQDSYTVRSYAKQGAPGAPPVFWFDYEGDLILSDGVFASLPY